MSLDWGTGVEKPKGDPRFHAILKELADLHDKKQADYGRETDPFANVRASEEWGIDGWVGALVRANDKMRRLQTFAKNGVLANEGVMDSFYDLAVYAIIAAILYTEQSKNEKNLGTTTHATESVRGAAVSPLSGICRVCGRYDNRHTVTELQRCNEIWSNKYA